MPTTEAQQRHELIIPELMILHIERFQDAFQRLRCAKLEKCDEDVIPFSNANFEVQSMRASDVLPATFYALQSRLTFQRNFRDKLEKKGIDLFNLNGIVYFWDGHNVRALIPPIVEVYKEPELIDAETMALQDGVHRMLIADVAGLSQRCIIIYGGLAEEQYLPHGIPNAWSDITIRMDTPPVEMKRKYRRPSRPYSNMRPFSALTDPRMHAIWADYGRPRQ